MSAWCREKPKGVGSEPHLTSTPYECHWFPTFIVAAHRFIWHGSGSFLGRAPEACELKLTAGNSWGTTQKEIYFWNKLRGLLARMSESDRRLLLHMARKMARPELARHKKGWASHSRGTEIL